MFSIHYKLICLVLLISHIVFVSPIYAQDQSTLHEIQSFGGGDIIQFTHNKDYLVVATPQSIDAYNKSTGSFQSISNNFDKELLNIVKLSLSSSNILAISFKDRIILINIVDNKKTADFNDNDNSILTMEWSPDGEKIAILYDTQTLVVWDIESNDVVIIAKNLRGTGFSSTIYWLPDSNALLIDTKMEIKIVDVFSSDIINTIPINQFRWTRWSANQKYLVLEDFTQSFVWDMEQQEIIAEFGANDSSFTWLSNTDFVFFRISEENKTTKLIRYSILTKQETIITTFKHIIHSMSLSPDEDFLLLDSVSRLDIWDISEKGVVQTLDNSTFSAFNFGFRPILGTVWASKVDSIFLLTQYHGIYLWDVNEDKITRLISDIHLGRTTAVSWAHNKPMLAGSGSINWYSSIDTNENIEWIQTNNGFITDIEWSFDDKYIAMISKQGTLDIYDVINKNIHNLNTRGLSNCHNRLSWSPIDNRLAWIGNDYAVHIWNLETDTEISSIIPDVTYNIGDDDTLCFNSVIWSHSGKYLFSSGSDGIVRQWNTDNLQNISEIQYLREITDIAISYDDSYLAVAGKTSYPLAVLLINLLNDDVQRLDISISHRVTSLDWAPDDNILAISRIFEGLVIYHLSDGDYKILDTPYLISTHDVQWSPDGNYIATSNEIVQVWEWK